MNVDILENNTWTEEYTEWLGELNKRRLEAVDKWDVDSYDAFYNLGDRCWGDINGRLSVQFFNLLNELKEVSPDLYSTYSETARTILKLFSFNSSPVE